MDNQPCCRSLNEISTILPEPGLSTIVSKFGLRTILSKLDQVVNTICTRYTAPHCNGAKFHCFFLTHDGHQRVGVLNFSVSRYQAWKGRHDSNRSRIAKKGWHSCETPAFVSQALVVP